VRFRSKPDVRVVERYQQGDIAQDQESKQVDDRIGRKETTFSKPTPPPSITPKRKYSIMSRLGATALLLASVLSLLQGTGLFRKGALPVQGAAAGVIPPEAHANLGVDLSRRDDSPTDVCFRWAQQSAVVNGTLYLYGGQASQQQGQKSNTWNNDFLTLDLTKTWQIASPSLSGLPQPSGPPAVALGTLWNSHDSLFLYGGEFSSAPTESPTAYSTWEYDITSQQWIEHSNPQTSSGKSAPSNNDPVQRNAEGAAANVPSLGRGFYFGGHQDPYTTEGWAQPVPRIYLQSLLEFTFPDNTNNQVDALNDGKQAGTDGNYRNITEGGLQSAAGFTERADGLLIYIPGFGAQGILLALAGGSNETFTQMNNIDVYDIDTSSWYKQSTAGTTPKIRVNPCAVVAAAPDGSSYNIYMFGGQNLVPAGSQEQYQDMWILSVPSFTWIEVDQSKQSVPYGRSGHTCNIWNGQMVMVGGYVGDQLSCESPGIYVYDLSKLQWVQQYTALSAGTDASSSSTGGSGSGSSSGSSTASTNNAEVSGSSSSSSDFNSTGSNNPFNQQPAQLHNDTTFGGLEGSYGYQVPEAVVSVIGGGPTGGATITTPVATATGGPLATGKPVTYTVTGPDGSTITETATPGNPNGGTSSSGSSKSGPNIAAIVAGVVAGVLFILVCYLLFCTYIYRKQLGLYKRHVEMAQAQARGEKTPTIPGLLATNSSSEKGSSDRRRADLVAWDTNSGNGYSSRQPQASSSSAAQSAGASGYQTVRRDSSTEDLLANQEPTFVGVLLNPRRSLRVVNKD